jgi:CheY-like chemotaxis protein
MISSANILMVEDNKMDIVLALDAFKEARLSNNIFIVKTGEEALDYLFGREKFNVRTLYPLPNLILLDLKLPGLDGFEVLRQVKNTETLKRIPVVILTSSREEGDRTLSYDIGANSYLLKPVSFDGFVEVVRKIDDYWFTLNIGASDI